VNSNRHHLVSGFTNSSLLVIWLICEHSQFLSLIPPGFWSPVALTHEVAPCLFGSVTFGARDMTEQDALTGCEHRMVAQVTIDLISGSNGHPSAAWVEFFGSPLACTKGAALGIRAGLGPVGRVSGCHWRASCPESLATSPPPWHTFTLALFCSEVRTRTRSTIRASADRLHTRCSRLHIN
jgi:hypothetical protein